MSLVREKIQTLGVRQTALQILFEKSRAAREKNARQSMSSPGKSKLTCYFWVRDQFLPETECSSSEASVLLQLAGYGNPDGTCIRPGNPNLVAVTKLERSTVKDAIKFWLHHSAGVLIEESKGGGRGHAAVFSIRMFNIEPKRVSSSPVSSQERVAENPLSDNKGVHQPPVSHEKGVERGGERGGERGRGATPTELPNYRKDLSGRNHHQDHCGKPDDDYHQKLLGFKTDVLKRSQDDSQGTIAVALDILIERFEVIGIRVNSAAYFEKALSEFVKSPQDMQLVKERLHHGAPL